MCSAWIQEAGIINPDPTFLGEYGVSEAKVTGSKEFAKQADNAAVASTTGSGR